ncbi:DUF4056 domain-containing protein [Photobacterium leiognathi]|uniref:DUF4056 domain-containing protein n=1 Tax=Photobacterium leiognathi TaxID=553611 RepID=UPI0034E94BB8
MKTCPGTDYRISLPAELRARHISLKKSKRTLTSPRKDYDISPDLAALLAFRLADIVD